MSLKACPYCAEDIKAEAKICRFCSNDVGTSSDSEPRLQHQFASDKCIHCGGMRDSIETYGNKCILDMKRYQPKKKELCCPKCSSEQLSANKVGFGLGKAAAGGIALGGIGLFGGFVGSGKVRITCLSCGHAWKAGTSAK